MPATLARSPRRRRSLFSLTVVVVVVVVAHRGHPLPCILAGNPPLSELLLPTHTRPHPHRGHLFIQSLVVGQHPRSLIIHRVPMSVSHSADLTLSAIRFVSYLSFLNIAPVDHHFLNQTSLKGQIELAVTTSSQRKSCSGFSR